jgi:transposase InsO family protein
MYPHPLNDRKTTDSHDHRFNAIFVDYMWHTDLHQLGSFTDEQNHPHFIYAIAFIDDASRYIMGAALLFDKTSLTCAAVLRGILEQGHVPVILGSDNGGEFRGAAFTRLLSEYHIRPWYGKPYTPQQNGKIERFWSTLHQSTNGSSDPAVISRCIEMYNHQWSHAALKMTPAEARGQMPHYRAFERLLSPKVEENLI